MNTVNEVTFGSYAAAVYAAMGKDGVGYGDAVTITENVSQTKPSAISRLFGAKPLEQHKISVVKSSSEAVVENAITSQRLLAAFKKDIIGDGAEQGSNDKLGTAFFDTLKAREDFEGIFSKENSGNDLTAREICLLDEIRSQYKTLKGTFFKGDTTMLKAGENTEAEELFKTAKQTLCDLEAALKAFKDMAEAGSEQKKLLDSCVNDAINEVKQLRVDMGEIEELDGITREEYIKALDVTKKGGEDRAGRIRNALIRYQDLSEAIPNLINGFSKYFISDDAKQTVSKLGDLGDTIDRDNMRFQSALYKVDTSKNNGGIFSGNFSERMAYKGVDDKEVGVAVDELVASIVGMATRVVNESEDVSKPDNGSGAGDKKDYFSYEKVKAEVKSLKNVIGDNRYELKKNVIGKDSYCLSLDKNKKGVKDSQSLKSEYDKLFKEYDKLKDGNDDGTDFLLRKLNMTADFLGDFLDEKSSGLLLLGEGFFKQIYVGKNDPNNIKVRERLENYSKTYLRKRNDFYSEEKGQTEEKGQKKLKYKELEGAKPYCETLEKLSLYLALKIKGEKFCDYVQNRVEKELRIIHSVLDNNTAIWKNEDALRNVCEAVKKFIDTWKNACKKDEKDKEGGKGETGLRGKSLGEFASACFGIIQEVKNVKRLLSEALVGYNHSGTIYGTDKGVMRKGEKKDGQGNVIEGKNAEDICSNTVRMLNEAQDLKLEDGIKVKSEEGEKVPNGYWNKHGTIADDALKVLEEQGSKFDIRNDLAIHLGGKSPRGKELTLFNDILETYCFYTQVTGINANGNCDQGINISFFEVKDPKKIQAFDIAFVDVSKTVKNVDEFVKKRNKFLASGFKLDSLKYNKAKDLSKILSGYEDIHDRLHDRDWLYDVYFDDSRSVGGGQVNTVHYESSVSYGELENNQANNINIAKLKVLKDINSANTGTLTEIHSSKVVHAGLGALPSSESDLGGHNLAVQKSGELLLGKGPNVIVNTQIVSKDGGRMAVAMEFAPGATGGDIPGYKSVNGKMGSSEATDKKSFENFVTKLENLGGQEKEEAFFQLAEQFNDLEWVDWMTGDVDRHGFNAIADLHVSQKDGKPHVSVKGIDNDLSFMSYRTGLNKYEIPLDSVFAEKILEQMAKTFVNKDPHIEGIMCDLKQILANNRHVKQLTTEHCQELCLLVAEEIDKGTCADIEGFLRGQKILIDDDKKANKFDTGSDAFMELCNQIKPKSRLRKKMSQIVTDILKDPNKNIKDYNIGTVENGVWKVDFDSMDAGETKDNLAKQFVVRSHRKPKFIRKSTYDNLLTLKGNIDKHGRGEEDKVSDYLKKEFAHFNLLPEELKALESRINEMVEYANKMVEYANKKEDEDKNFIIPDKFETRDGVGGHKEVVANPNRAKMLRARFLKEKKEKEEKDGQLNSTDSEYKKYEHGELSLFERLLACTWGEKGLESNSRDKNVAPIGRMFNTTLEKTSIILSKVDEVASSTNSDIAESLQYLKRAGVTDQDLVNYVEQNVRNVDDVTTEMVSTCINNYKTEVSSAIASSESTQSGESENNNEISTSANANIPNGGVGVGTIREQLMSDIGDEMKRRDERLAANDSNKGHYAGLGKLLFSPIKATGESEDDEAEKKRIEDLMLDLIREAGGYVAYKERAQSAANKKFDIDINDIDINIENHDKDKEDKKITNALRRMGNYYIEYLNARLEEKDLTIKAEDDGSLSYVKTDATGVQ